MRSTNTAVAQGSTEGGKSRAADSPPGHPRYADEEIVRRGREIYDTTLRHQVGTDNEGKILVIDIESGEFEIDPDHLAAVHRLLDRNPGAALFAMRVGYPSLAKIGGRWGPVRP